MRNEETYSQKLLSAVERLPIFTFENVRITGIPTEYLKILLSRKVKAGEVIRLKRGIYTTKKYIQRAVSQDAYPSFVEYAAVQMYQPSYVSLEYALAQHNLLTDAPIHLTLMTWKKTMRLSNKLGTFLYHTIREELFGGYATQRKHGFSISTATPAKALFDYLYLRKAILINRQTIEELRLNTEEFSSADRRELGRWVRQEGSERMRNIFDTVCP